jgi:hypothetical protein
MTYQQRLEVFQGYGFILCHQGKGCDKCIVPWIQSTNYVGYKVLIGHWLSNHSQVICQGLGNMNIVRARFITLT